MKDKIDLLLHEVLSRQPVLAKIYHEHGQQSVSDYVQSWAVAASSNPSVVSVVKQVCEDLYGSTIAEQVAQQLTHVPLVSTVDHHGILNHPFFLNSNLVFSLRDKQQYLICLPTAGVSLNNSSWPGSLVYHDQQSEKLQKISFFSERFKHQTVLGAAALNAADLNRASWRSVDMTNLPELQRVILGLFNDEQILTAKNFSEQATRLSSKAWQLYFPDAPMLIYLPLEDVVGRILIEQLGDTHSLFSRLLGAETGWQLLEHYFNGLRGAFDTANVDKGSFLFWGLDKDGQRVRLVREGNTVVGGKIPTIKPEREQIVQLLKHKAIYPSSLLCFLVLLESGLTCLGGFNQTTWLSQVKEKFIDLLTEMGELPVADRVASLTTDNFAECDLAFLLSGERIVKATGSDILLKGDKHLFEKYSKLGQLLSLADSITLALPEMYRVVVPAAERMETCVNVSVQAIAESIDVVSKLRQAAI